MNKYVNPPCKVTSDLPRRSLQIMSDCEAAVGDLFLEAPFRTSSSEVGATTSNSDHNRINPKGPGDIRTNKWFPGTIIH